MALAETAQLAVNLTLGGNFTSGLGQAESRLAGFNAAAAGTSAKTAAVSSAFGSVKTAALGVGGALAHAGSQIKGLITGPLGFLGLTGGLLGLGGVLSGSISKMRDFGETVDKTMGLTGLGVEKASALAAALSYVGVQGDTIIKSLGMAEKNLFKLAGTTENATKFQQTYGLSLTDTNGKLVDANELLLRSADFYKNNTNRAQVAAAMAAIYGRSWQNLIEVFELGRDKIAAAEETAAKLGLTLSGSNLDAILKFRDVTRDMSTAMGGLQLSIGLALLPTLTDLATSITKFVSDHRTDIANFFRNAAQAARNIAGTIANLAGTVMGFWNSIPPEVRDLLVKGFIADRTIKFLFGFDPVKAIGSAVLGGGMGGIFGRGGTPLNPVFVKDVGIGGKAGLGTLESLAGAGIGATVTAAASAIIAGGALGLLMGAVGEWVLSTSNDPTGVKARQQIAAARGLNPQNAAPTLPGGPRSAAPYTPGIPYTGGLPGGKIQQPSFGGFDFEPALYDTAAAVRGLTDALHDFRFIGEHQRKALQSPVSAIMKEIHDASVARFGGQGLGTSAERGTFQRMMLRWAERIAGSGEDSKQKLADLQRVEQNLRDAGMKVPAKLDRLIAKAKQDVNVTVNNIVPIRIYVPGPGAGSTVAKSVITHAAISESRLV